MRGLGRGLTTIAACAGALAGLQLAAVFAGWGPGASDPVAALPALFGVLYVATGLVAWARRPHNRIGTLLVAAGVAWIGWGLRAADVPVLAAVGLLCESLPFAIVVHLLLAFPSGRLQGRLDRIVVAIGYLAIPLVHVPTELLGASSADGIGVLDVAGDPALADVATAMQTAVDGLVILLAAALLWHRRATGDPRWRRLGAPLTVAGIAALAAIGLLDVLEGAGFPATGGPAADLVDVLGIALVVALPVGFAATLRGGFAAVGDLEELVREPPERGRLVAAVADALGDPSAQLVYWLPDERRYVDEAGAPLQPARGVQEVTHNGRRVGAIAYDRALLRDAGPVRSVARIAGLALDHERLAAELRAHARALEASRARLTKLADAERRRIARDLHDGAQQRLVLLAVASERIARAADDPRTVRRIAAEMRAGSDAAISELRALVEGLVPPLLAERGLRAAAAELAASAPIPVAFEADPAEPHMPEHVESAGYFVISEALVNVAKHARATQATVSLHHYDGALRIEVADNGVGGIDRTRGTGLDGLADRVAAAGGRLDVISPPGLGTHITAELPCES
jgi:signal transduction histidine kinase